MLDSQGSCASLMEGTKFLDINSRSPMEPKNSLDDAIKVSPLVM